MVPVNGVACHVGVRWGVAIEASGQIKVHPVIGLAWPYVDPRWVAQIVLQYYPRPTRAACRKSTFGLHDCLETHSGQGSPRFGLSCFYSSELLNFIV